MKIFLDGIAIVIASAGVLLFAALVIAALVCFPDVFAVIGGAAALIWASSRLCDKYL